jgi:hypothetical protein
MTMPCQWCATRKTEWWILPNVGPQSRACTPCRDRVCKRDEKGAYICEPYEEQDGKKQ